MALKQVSTIIEKSLVRATDRAFRFGGEEFVVIMPAISSEGVLKVANKLLDDINDRKIAHKHSKVASHITVSIGGCTMSSNEVEETMILKNADSALYEAKDLGRNQVVTFGAK